MMSLLVSFMLQYNNNNNNNNTNKLYIRTYQYGLIEHINVVSSAYINILKTRLTLGKSLMYIRKSKGPKIEPWGTPIEIDFVFDLEPLYSTYGCLLER